MNTDYLVTGETTKVRENGATSGVGVLATYAYDNLGNRTGVTYGNGAAQAFTYDAVSRLASLTNDLSGTTNDLSVTFAYNPANQITQTVRTGDAYAYTAMGNGSTSFTQNGLNQQITVGGSAASWDSKGNLTSEPQSGKTYGYSSENLLTSASGSVTLGYDPALRLYQVAGGTTTRFAYDGANVIADYDGSNALQHRYVFAGLDQPIVQYDASGNRAFLGSDERGSIISLTDSSGTLIALNSYDEYGKPASGNSGRFQYTGQMWLSEINAYNYKARMYLPHLGIFAQTDPIGYSGDGPNLYAYVLNDPVNGSDPTGLVCGTVTGSLIQQCDDNLVWALQDAGHLGASLVTVTVTMGGGSGPGGSSGQGGSLLNPSGISCQLGNVSACLQPATFVTSSNPTLGTYLGTQPDLSGNRINTTGQNGVNGALEDYANIAHHLGVTPDPLHPVTVNFEGLFTIHADFALTLVPSGVLGLRIYPTISYYGTDLWGPSARIDIPAGSFPGQRYRVTIHYYGAGDPPF